MAHHGTCALPMDNKPHQSPPTKTSFDISSGSDQQHYAIPSTQERSRKRVRRVVDSATTCVPEQLHCRYANKKCLNPRAVKRTGGLHTFCTVHRANANRNQRRLDMRKRMARQAMRAQDQALSIKDTAIPVQQGVKEQLSASDVYDTRFEPLHTPTALLEEDISTLVALFLPHSDPEFELQSDASPTFFDRCSTSSTSSP